MACISAVEDHLKNGEMDEVTKGREEERGNSPRETPLEVRKERPSRDGTPGTLSTQSKKRGLNKGQCSGRSTASNTTSLHFKTKLLIAPKRIVHAVKSAMRTARFLKS